VVGGAPRTPKPEVRIVEACPAPEPAAAAAVCPAACTLALVGVGGVVGVTLGVVGAGTCTISGAEGRENSAAIFPFIP
jgi:hypothetical protein